MPRLDVDEELLFPSDQPNLGRRRAPSHTATTPARERAVIVGLAAGGAVVGAFGAAEPASYPVSDALLQAGFVALVALGASRARRWTWLWLAGASVLVATGPFGSLCTVAALGVAVWAALTGQRRRYVGALVGALAAQPFLHQSPGGFYGLSALLTLAATAPVFVSAWRISPRRVRRRMHTGVAVVGGFVAVAVLALGASAAVASRDVEAGIDDARAGLTAARSANDEVAARSLDDAATHFDSAQSVVGGIWMAPARLVPGLAQHARVLDEATAQGLAVAESGEAVADVVDVDAMRLEGGRYNLGLIEATQLPLEENAATLRRAGRILDQSERPWLFPVLADRVDAFEAEIAAVVPEAEIAAEVAELAPALLGGEGERTYVLLFTQPAESRGLGGFVGSWGEMTAVDGDLDFVRSGPISELRDAAGRDERTVTGPDDYVQRYGRFQPWVTLQDVSLSPDYPSVADVMAQVYPQTGGAEVDGVITVDPYALAALMEFTGPITVPGLDRVLTAQNAADFLLREQYVAFANDDSAQENVLDAVASETFERLTSGNLPSPRRVSTVLHPLVEQGRLLVWSPRPDEEELFVEVGADGEFARPEGRDLISLVTHNAANNKIDAFMHRDLDYDVKFDPATGEVEATATIEITNDVPSLDLPKAVIGSNDQGLPPGTNEVWLHLYTPLQFVGATINGEPASLGSEREFGMWAYNRSIEIPPGETLVVQVELAGLITSRGRYGLTINQQPLVNDDHVRVQVEAPEGFEAVATRGLTAERDGRKVTVDTDLARDERLEVVYRRE